MKKQKFYYHILGRNSNGNFGYNNFYTSIIEGKKEIKRLSIIFPNCTFKMFIDTTKKETPLSFMNGDFEKLLDKIKQNQKTTL